ncbi:MAG: cell division protein FtsL [Desulfobacteraceae bacterium]|nr:cell division protein FtsL [Desulfobacteraceae bacterium]
MAPPPKDRKPAMKRMGLVWVAVLSLFVAELLFYTWCRVQCTRTRYLIYDDLTKHKELAARENSLNIELARLKTPENISRIARQKLALAMPDPQQIIWVPQP